MPAVLATITTVTQNLWHPSFINFVHYCSPSSGFYGEGKITEADTPTVHQGATPFFTLNAFSAATLQIYRSLGQAPSNDGLYTQWLVYLVRE